MKTKKLIQSSPPSYPKINPEECFEEIYQQLGSVDLWQIQLASVLMLPRAMRPPKEKVVSSLGLGNVTNYDNWARHPKIQSIKKILTKRYFRDVIPDIMLSMQNSALMGDVAAAKLFLQYIDDFNGEEQKQILNQVTVTSDQLSEILKNLKDKNV